MDVKRKELYVLANLIKTSLAYSNTVTKFSWKKSAERSHETLEYFKCFQW